jgi:peptidoglycan/xylan/chitin deacetylase (PgdA/CDA1 family)
VETAVTLVSQAKRAAKGAAKEVVARTWSAVRPVARRLPVARGDGWISLCYHRVCDDRNVSDPWLVVGTENFRRQVETLRRSYELVTQRELSAELAAGGRPKKPLCAITFDDGYADNLYAGLPVLERLGVPATIYLATDAMTGGALWYERVGAIVGNAVAKGARRELVSAAAEWLGREPNADEGVVEITKALCEAFKRVPSAERRSRVDALEAKVGPPGPGALPRFLSWDEVRELARAGWEIGNHTRTHPILPETPDAEAAEEIRTSHETIERETGNAPVGFAYPNGDTDDRIVGLVKSAGYRYAVVALPKQARKDDPYRIARRCISDHDSASWSGSFSSAAFLAQVEGALDRLR